jgi:hypothetical protein
MSFTISVAIAFGLGFWLGKRRNPQRFSHECTYPECEAFEKSARK